MTADKETRMPPAPEEKNVIRGLYLDVTAQEMRDHALARAEYHRLQGESIQKGVDEIKAGSAKADEISRSIGKAGTRTPTDELEKAVKHHKQRERFFTFSSAHFVDTATYRLELADLREFEIAPIGNAWSPY